VTLQPTPASEWRQPRQEGFVIQLPSGRSARIRPVALDVLIASGEIPNLLLPIASEILWVDSARRFDTDDPVEFKERGLGEAVPDYFKLISMVVPAALLEPRVAPEGQEPADDEITLADIDSVDKVTIFQLAVQPVEVLRQFHGKPFGSLGRVSNGDQNGTKAKRPARRKG
jgi:hypothetical protein